MKVKGSFFKENKETKKIETDLNIKIEKFIKLLKEEKKLNHYISVFGLTGPCARGEGFYINKEVMSDFDFFVITKKINPLNESYLKRKFNEIFGGSNTGLLVFSPTIFKKPDLMFFETTNSGKVLYGEKLKPISIKSISRFDAFRNLIYRGCFFLTLFNVKNKKIILKEKNKLKFLYYYSKIIFSIGEVFLLLTREYEASNFRRNEIIKKNKFAKKIKNFINEHESMHKFRYFKEVPNEFSFEEYCKKAFNFLIETYKILANELFNCDALINCKKFIKIRANLFSSLSGKLFFSVRYYKKTKKIKFHIFIEPFIYLTIKFNKLLNQIKFGKVSKKNFEDVLIYWKCAGWFYYYI